jgi:hypothetical protein
VLQPVASNQQGRQERQGLVLAVGQMPCVMMMTV